MNRVIEGIIKLHRSYEMRRKVMDIHEYLELFDLDSLIKQNFLSGLVIEIALHAHG
jgi:hypothetical protein